MRLLQDIANFETPQTQSFHNTMRYHELNSLPHALPHRLPYAFSDIYLILSYLQWVTMRYRQLFLKNSIYIFYKFELRKMSGSPLQVSQNQANLRENFTVTRVVTHVVTYVVTHLSQGKALHQGISCFQSLAMCGKVFKTNWSGFSLTKRYIIHRQYLDMFPYLKKLKEASGRVCEI